MLVVQFVYCGKKATLSIGNVKPVGDMPEGSIVCNVEEVCHPAHITGPLRSLANGRHNTIVISEHRLYVPSLIDCL